MTTAVLAALAILTLGAALQPKPAARGFESIDPPTRNRLRGTRARMLPRRPRVEPAELATWCDSLARAIRGGATLHNALRTVPAPECVDTPLAPAHLALERGASIHGALASVAATSPHLDLVLVVLRSCAENGGSAAEPIDRAAAALRQRAALAGERRTNSAQARLSALVMTLLPGAMLGMLLATSGSVRAVALSPIGLFVVALGAILNVTGWWWMRRLIAGATR